MYYDYYNNNIIISSVCMTILKTLKLGGKIFLFLYCFFLFNVQEISPPTVLTTLKKVSWSFVAYKWNSPMYCMSEKNVKRTQKALGHDSDLPATSLPLNIVNITFEGELRSLFFAAKCWTLKKQTNIKMLRYF